MTTKRVLLGLAVLIAVPLVVSGIGPAAGSGEMFPTQEQQEKARIAFALAFVFFGTLELMVMIALLWQSMQKSESTDCGRRSRITGDV